MLKKSPDFGYEYYRRKGRVGDLFQIAFERTNDVDIFPRSKKSKMFKGEELKGVRGCHEKRVKETLSAIYQRSSHPLTFEPK